MPLPDTRIPSKAVRWLATATLAGTTVLLATAVERLSKAAEPAMFEDVDQLAEKKGWKYFGSNTCKECHGRELNVDLDREWSLRNEYLLWQHDMHSKAYDNLSEDLGLQMGKLMGGIDVTKDERCLSCHAVVIPENLRGDGERLADGVSCDACHGPSSAWGFIHMQKDWRKKSTAEKAALGMRDLRNPVIHVELCASCHVGDAEKKRVITHDMYMAGHPPLPSLEPVNFAKVLPQHWVNLDKKSKEVQEEVKYPTGQHRSSQLYILNGVAAQLASMRLLSQEAAVSDSTNPWPKLAQFDCASCHHDLRAPSRDWRSGILNPVGPGMPDLATWPRVLSRLALFHADQSPREIEERFRDLDAALGTRPFGDPAAIPSKADAVAIECKSILRTLAENSRFDDAAVLRTFRELATIGSTQSVDYETARQLAWGARVFAADLGPALPNREVVERSLAALSSALYLDLPGGGVGMMSSSLPASLTAASAYHPEDFRREMSQIAEALGANK